MDGIRVAADRGRHARAHEQPEPGGAIRRENGARRVGEHRVGVGRAPDGHRGHPAHPHRHAARHRVLQVGLGAIEQRHGVPDAAGQRRGARGGHQALGAALRIGVELGRALERARGGGVPAAARGVVGREGQRLGRLVVRGRGGGGAVPRAPVGVGARRRARRPAPRAPRAARRSRRRGRRPSAAADGGSAAARPRPSSRPARSTASRASGPTPTPSAARSSVPTSPLSSAAASRSIAPRVVGEGLHAAHEGPLDALVQRQVEAQRRAAGALVVAERARQLEQRERVAAGDVDQLVAHDRGQGAVEQGPRLGVAQPGEPQLGQPVRLERARVALARSDQHGDRVGLQPPGDEHERLGRRAVEPVGVVDHAQQRLVVGHGREQAQHGDRDEEAVLDALGGQPEGAAQGRGLDVGELVGEVEDRPQQLVQAGERQLGLGLDAGAGEHAHPVRARQRALQQRGLADPRVAAQHEHAAARVPGRVEQAVDRRALALSAQEHAPTLRRTRRWD